MDKKKKLTEAYIKTSKPEEILLDTVEKLQEFDTKVKEIEQKFNDTYDFALDNKEETKQKLINILKPLIPKPLKGKDAENPSDEKLLEIIKPLIPEPKNGIDGSPDTAEQVRDKIASLEGAERLSVLSLKDTEWLKGAKDQFIQGNIVGGILKVNHDNTLSGDGTNDSPLKVTSSGVTKFTQLSDVPASYSGQGGKVVSVKSDASGLEFTTNGTGDVTGPAGATGDDIAVYNGATGKLIKDGGKKISDLALASDLTNYELLSNKQTDLTASATKYPTVNAVNTGLATNSANDQAFAIAMSLALS